MKKSIRITFFEISYRASMSLSGKATSLFIYLKRFFVFIYFTFILASDQASTEV